MELFQTCNTSREESAIDDIETPVILSQCLISTQPHAFQNKRSKFTIEDSSNTTFQINSPVILFKSINLINSLCIVFF